MFAKVLGGGVAAVGLGTAYAYHWATENMGSDAVERMMRFSKVAVPLIVEYKWLEAKLEKLPGKFPDIFPALPDEEQTRQFQVLHDKWAPPAFDCFMELGGFYYKNGQKVASNASGVFPKSWVDYFQPFLNDIPARTMDDIRAVIENELTDGRKLEDVFSEFEEKPIGCASIGQVHRARLKSNGRRVVVKVQNPDAERTFRGDVFALEVVMDTFMPQMSVAFREIKKQFATEFDYRGECRNQIEIKRNLEKAGFDVIVPEVVLELCTRKMMVMEEVYPSTPLHDQLLAQAELMAKQKGMTTQEFLDMEQERVRLEEVALAKEGKVKESVTASQYDQYIALQRSKGLAYRTLKYCYNYTLGWFLPNYDMSKQEDSVVVPLNAARLMDDLFAVHGHEILINGCFNGDPHPGNILCVDGKLALIDYGQVKRLSDRQRYQYAKLILFVEAAVKVDPRSDPNVDPELHARARESLIRYARSLGVKTKYDLDETHYDMMTVYYGRVDRAFIYPRNFIQFTDFLESRDPMQELPEELDYFILSIMTGMMLQGLAQSLQQYRTLAACWAPYARRALSEREGLLEAVEAEITAWTAEAGDE